MTRTVIGDLEGCLLFEGSIMIAIDERACECVCVPEKERRCAADTNGVSVYIYRVLGYYVLRTRQKLRVVQVDAKTV